MIISEVWATRGELPFRKPELTDRHDTGEFEAILPNIAVMVLPIVASAANTPARDDALRDEMKRTGTECAGGARQECVLAKVGGHVVAILFPLIPIAGADNGGVLWPHGRIDGRNSGRALSKKRSGGEHSHGSREKYGGENLTGVEFFFHCAAT